MKKRIISILTLAIILVGLILWGGHKVKQMLNGNGLVNLSLVSNPEIDRTPVEINSIRQIGQWEFLSVKTEELVDSVKKGIIFDDRIACIYQGALSLGINMENFDKSWITAQGKDSISLSLPPVTLLDHNFINESKTNVFMEEGTWKEMEKEQLYQKAKQKMLRRACSKENMDLAEKNARRQITQLMNSMGFKHVNISFRKNSGPQQQK